MSGSVAIKLIKYSGDIYLKGLKGLSDKTAEVLAKHKYSLYLSAAAEEAVTAAMEREQSR